MANTHALHGIVASNKGSSLIHQPQGEPMINRRSVLRVVCEHAHLFGCVF